MIYCIFCILVIKLQSSFIFLQHVLFFLLLVPVTFDILYIPLSLHTPTHNIPSPSLSLPVFYVTGFQKNSHLSLSKLIKQQHS